MNPPLPKSLHRGTTSTFPSVTPSCAMIADLPVCHRIVGAVGPFQSLLPLREGSPPAAIVHEVCATAEPTFAVRSAQRMHKLPVPARDVGLEHNLSAERRRPCSLSQTRQIPSR